MGDIADKIKDKAAEHGSKAGDIADKIKDKLSSKSGSTEQSNDKGDEKKAELEGKKDERDSKKAAKLEDMKKFILSRKDEKAAGAGKAAGGLFNSLAEEAKKSVRVTGIADGSSKQGAVADVGAEGADVAGRFGTLKVKADGTWTYDVNKEDPTVRAFGKRKNLLTDVFTVKVAADDGAKKDLHIVVKIWELL